MHEQNATERPREVVPVHYGNRYAAVVEFVARNGRSRFTEIAEGTGVPPDNIRVYLTRAVRRGHLFRPERGVYTATESDPTGHWHRVCFSCGQPMRGGVK